MFRWGTYVVSTHSEWALAISELWLGSLTEDEEHFWPGEDKFEAAFLLLSSFVITFLHSLCVQFSPRNHRGRAGLPAVRHVELGRAAVRHALGPAALQGWVSKYLFYGNFTGIINKLVTVLLIYSQYNKIQKLETLLQGGERRGDEGQHRQREVQVRVPLQGGHHGGHEAAHVDLQEDALVSRAVPLLVYALWIE